MEGLSMAKQHPNYKPTTLCDVCANACGGCSWSEQGVQQPVEGWDAIRHDVAANDKSKGYARMTLSESYVVLACPMFELEERHRWAYERFDPEVTRRRLAHTVKTGAAVKKRKRKEEDSGD